VCARDLYRLCRRFEGTAAARLPAYALLQRLLAEQCAVVAHAQAPEADADDVDEGAVPVILKAKENVTGASLPSPHDPDATYSGHKGKGYSVQVAETCGADNDTQIITHVSVTDACQSDAQAALPVLADLEERGLRPAELVADTSYGGTENVLAATTAGTELVSPVAGSSEPTRTVTALRAVDFEVAADGTARCPAGQAAQAQRRAGHRGHGLVLSFAPASCDACPLRAYCPARWQARTATYGIRIDPYACALASRRRAQSHPSFRERYAIRAGIEATNSELKRGHGLGRLRVRGRPRVRLVAYLKALGCNLKRMVHALLRATVRPVPAVG